MFAIPEVDPPSGDVLAERSRVTGGEMEPRGLPGTKASRDAGPEVQACHRSRIIVAALREAGGGAEDIVRTRTYIMDAEHAEHAESIDRPHAVLFRNVRSASTMVVVAGLLDPRWKVEIEAEAILG